MHPLKKRSRDERPTIQALRDHITMLREELDKIHQDIRTRPPLQGPTVEPQTQRILLPNGRHKHKNLKTEFEYGEYDDKREQKSATQRLLRWNTTLTKRLAEEEEQNKKEAAEAMADLHTSGTGVRIGGKIHILK